MTSDNRFSRRHLILIVFVAATTWKVWLGGPGIIPEAQAQIPDSGLQRKLILDEVRKSNQLLEQLVQTLQNGTLKVRIEGTDKKSAPRNATREPSAP